MFERSRALSVGQTHHAEIRRIVQDPSLIDPAEAAALLTHWGLVTADMSAIFQARELNGYSRIKAHLLSKDEAKAMVEGEMDAVYLVGLRTRHYREFVGFVREQKALALDIVGRRAEAACRSHEWGLWFRQLAKYPRLTWIVARLRVQSFIYRCGFECDPAENMERLAALLRRSRKTPTRHVGAEFIL